MDTWHAESNGAWSSITWLNDSGVPGVPAHGDTVKANGNTVAIDIAVLDGIDLDCDGGSFYASVAVSLSGSIKGVLALTHDSTIPTGKTFTIHRASVLAGNSHTLTVAGSLVIAPYYQVEQAGQLQDVTVVAGGGTATYTAASNVRYNTDRGDGVLGTCHVPGPDDVRASTPVDATIGNLIVPAAANLALNVHAGWHHVGPPETWEVTGSSETVVALPAAGYLTLVRQLVYHSGVIDVHAVTVPDTVTLP